jgi:hypothetical protein
MDAPVHKMAMNQEVSSYRQEKNEFNKPEKQVYQRHIFQYIPCSKKKNEYINRNQKKAAGIDKAATGPNDMGNTVDQYKDSRSQMQ